MRRARRKKPWRLPVALVVSAVAHPLLGALYEARRPPPTPTLVVELEREGAGTGVVVSTDGRIDCAGAGGGGACAATFSARARVTLTATVGERSTFMGWSETCGAQSYRLFRWLAAHAPPDPASAPAVAAELSGLSTQPLPHDPRSCTVVLDESLTVVARFGEQPKEVEVAWLSDDAIDDIALPDRATEAARVTEPDRPKPVTPPPDQPIELAMIPPPPETPPPVQPVPPPAEEKKKIEVEASRLKSVEVPDENEVDKAPDDAAFLSDKNRDVAEQTVAKDTNLEREQKGEVSASAESAEKSEEVGGQEDEIAQLETSEQTALEVERAEETAKDGEDEIAKGIDVGAGGQAGEQGQGGDGRPSETPGLLSMRGITGRGAPGGPVAPVDEGAGASGEIGTGGERGRPGRRGATGIKTQLEQEDYERIVGQDKADEEVALARRTASARKGRWEKKLGAIRSSLENFTPEVRTGNQTALKTRAAPFAVYIARMHRRIHELWGFGFLEDLDDKPASNAMNDFTLWTKIETVINPDGTVDKTTIVRSSGVLTFDVAALDTMLTAGPYEPPPEVIRSANGKTYVHWSFHRDWRQCGTFGAEPFITTTPPSGDDRSASSGLLDALPGRPGRGGGSPTGGEDARAAAARAQANVGSPDDPEASYAANLWLTGFTHGDLGKMLKVSAVPFVSGGQAVASTPAEVSRIYADVLKESRAGVIKDWKLVSAAGYRKMFGSLPLASEGAGELYLVVRLPREQFTVVLREGGGGEYKAVGFFR